MVEAATGASGEAVTKGKYEGIRREWLELRWTI